MFAALVLVVSLVFVPQSGFSQRSSGGYWRHLRSLPLAAGQLVSILMISGHFVLFTYLALYISNVIGLNYGSVVLAFVSFGIAGVAGGYFGGWLSDAFSPRGALLITPLFYLTALVCIPFVASMPWVMFIVMMVWGSISWMISPVVQSFLITTGPDTAEAGVSLNFSAMHIGVGLGTAIGGLTLETLSLSALPWTGSVLASLAIAASIMAVCASKASKGGDKPAAA